MVTKDSDIKRRYLQQWKEIDSHRTPMCSHPSAKEMHTLYCSYCNVVAGFSLTDDDRTAFEGFHMYEIGPPHPWNMYFVLEYDTSGVGRKWQSDRKRAWQRHALG
jgi:hypothetical protein